MLKKRHQISKTQNPQKKDFDLDCGREIQILLILFNSQIPAGYCSKGDGIKRYTISPILSVGKIISITSNITKHTV